ncbi:MAG: FKBP-type peptidyl-prolyl cis-trans isomerase [Gemmatimonadota bacterium]
MLLRNISRMLLPASLVLAACSSPTGESPVIAIEATNFATALGVNLAGSTKLPSGMYIRDLDVGTGTAVANGQLLSMRYTGWLANGTQFDATGTKPPFQFRLGSGQVIAGWDQGVAGMKVGGKRQLVIPPALGYGSRTNGPIPGNSVLVFNVEVVSAQ